MEKVKKGVRLEHISKIYQDPKTGKEKTYKYKKSFPVLLTKP